MQLIRYEPISLPALTEYELLKQDALKSRKVFDSFFELANHVISMYEAQFPELRDTIGKLRVEIRNLTRGVPDTEGQEYRDSLELLDKSAGASSTDRFLVKRLYKKLCMLYHPDRGGDVETFQSIERARSSNDLVFLQSLFTLSFKEPNLGWRCSEGASFWRTQRAKIEVNLESLKAEPSFAVVKLHMQGKPEEAALAVQRVLETACSILRAELYDLSIQGVFRGKTQDEEQIPQGRKGGEVLEETFRGF